MSTGRGAASVLFVQTAICDEACCSEPLPLFTGRRIENQLLPQSACKHKQRRMESYVNMAKYFVLFVSLLVLGISIGSNLLFLKYKSQETRDSYEHRRKNFMEQEGLMRTGGDLKLNSKEEALNSKLMAMKLKEIQAYRDDGDGHNFPPAVNFLKSKPNIEKSEVFKFIHTMPKGNLITLNCTVCR